MNGNRSLQAEVRTRPVGHHLQTTRSTHPGVAPAAADGGRVADAITARIAATKRRLLDGGVLQPVEWGVPGEPDVRGRKTFTYSMLDAVVEQRPALQREGGFTTDRADNTVLIILDPVAITDGHTFRWGGHTYKVKAIDGVVQNAVNGVLLSSEVTVIR